MAASGVRRLLQWRMRTLLILMALVGGGLTFWNYFVAIYFAQETAVESLADYAAQIESEAAAPQFLAPLVGADRYHKIVQCRLTGYEVDDAALAQLDKLPFLERLYLATTSIGDQGAARIARLPRLERLSLWRTRITDAGLQQIARVRTLRVLDLHDTCVTDEGLAALLPLEDLRYLKLGGPIHGPGLRHIAKLPKLQELDLGETVVVYDQLSHLAGSGIRELHLGSKTPVKIPSQIPATAIQHLRKLPNLRDFHGAVVEASDADVEALCHCRRLRIVDISGLGITDAAIKSLQKLPRLRELRLHGDLSDETLTHVAEMKQLDQVHLTGRFTFQAIEKLVERQPTIVGTIRTLFEPKHYYSNGVRKIGSLSIEPLIHMGRQRYGGPSLAIQNVSRLHVRVHWPATIEDLAALKNIRERAYAVYTQAPPSLRPNDYNPNWSLKGIEEIRAYSLHLGRARREDLARLGDCKNLRELFLLDQELTDDDLDSLALPQYMRSVFIAASHVTPTGAEKLRWAYPQLMVGTSGHGKIFGGQRWQSPTGGLSTVAQIADAFPSLRTVQLGGVNLPVDLTPLAALTDLERIEIRAARTGGWPRQQMWSLSKPCLHLTQLSLPGLGVTDPQLAQLQFMPELRVLHLRNSSISDQAFQHFKHLPELREVHLQSDRPILRNPSGPWITGIGLGELAKNCPKLTQIDLKNSWCRDEHVSGLASLKHLTHLHLDSTEVGDRACQTLAMLPALDTLSLNMTQVTDKGLAYLSNAPKLKRLTVFRTKVTPAAVTKFRELRPEINVRN